MSNFSVSYDVNDPVNIFLDARQLSKRYRINLNSVYDLMRSEGFPCIQFNRTKRVRLDNLIEWENRNGFYGASAV